MLLGKQLQHCNAARNCVRQLQYSRWDYPPSDYQHTGSGVLCVHTQGTVRTVPAVICRSRSRLFKNLCQILATLGNISYLCPVNTN